MLETLYVYTALAVVVLFVIAALRRWSAAARFWICLAYLGVITVPLIRDETTPGWRAFGLLGYTVVLLAVVETGTRSGVFCRFTRHRAIVVEIVGGPVDGAELCVRRCVRCGAEIPETVTRRA